MKTPENLFPPGAEIKRDITRFVSAAVILIFCWSLSFLLRYLSELDRASNVYPLSYPHIISGLNELMRHSFTGFWGYAAVCAYFAVSNYLSFRISSKSWYVMRRVKSGAEIHVRSLAAPVLALVGGAILTAILMLLYIILYLYATPDKYLPAYAGFDLWGALL